MTERDADADVVVDSVDDDDDNDAIPDAEDDDDDGDGIPDAEEESEDGADGSSEEPEAGEAPEEAETGGEAAKPLAPRRALRTAQDRPHAAPTRYGSETSWGRSLFISRPAAGRCIETLRPATSPIQSRHEVETATYAG